MSRRAFPFRKRFTERVRAVEEIDGVSKVELEVRDGRHAVWLVVTRVGDNTTKGFPVGSSFRSRRGVLNSLAEIRRWARGA